MVSLVRFNVRCPRCCEIIHDNSENKLRADIALHLTKHSQYSENETKCRMMLWADDVIHQFYFEASYSVEGETLSTYYNEVWVVAFVRDPSAIKTYEDSMQDQTRINLLLKMFEEIRQSEYDAVLSSESDMIPLKYEHLTNVPRTKAVRVRISKKDKNPLTVREVVTLLESKLNLLVG